MKIQRYVMVALLAGTLGVASCKQTPKTEQSAVSVDAIQAEVLNAGRDFSRVQTIIAERKPALEKEIERCKKDQTTPLRNTACQVASAVAIDLIGQHGSTDTTASLSAMELVSGKAEAICEQNPGIRDIETNCDKVRRYDAGLASRLTARQIAVEARMSPANLSELTVHYETLRNQIRNDWPALASAGPAVDVGQQIRQATVCSADDSYNLAFPLASGSGDIELIQTAREAIAAGVGSLNWALCAEGEASCDRNVCDENPDSEDCIIARSRAAALICLNPPS
jgi:hypothetical protein